MAAESRYSPGMTAYSLRLPSITIGDLIRVGLRTVVVRCLHSLCKGETVVQLASFPVEMHETLQWRVDWACTHCGRAQVVTEQPAAHHWRYRPVTLDEMRHAAKESEEAYIPCRPRQVVIEDDRLLRSGADRPLSVHRSRS